MEKNIKNFINKFCEVKQQGWIESCYAGKSSVGRTFENAIGCHENSLEIPDYNGIEIKTKFSKKNKYINLFNCKSESCFYKNTTRLKDLYGYPDKNFNNYKILNVAVYCIKKTMVGNKYQFQLNINKKHKRIYLYVYDLNNNLIDNESYWDFDDLKEKLYRKLKLLAYVKAIKKKKNNREYFKYYKLYLYTLKDFNKFIDMFEKGYIRINFKFGIYKCGRKFGQSYDHGTGIEIKECFLLEMYDKLDFWNFTNKKSF